MGNTIDIYIKARPRSRQDEREAIRASLGGAIRLATGDFARGSVSVDVRAPGKDVTWTREYVARRVEHP